MPLTFWFWNVQHGSAAYIETPNGKQMAIDLGADDAFSPLQYLWQRGIRKLDHVTITHPHMDHIDDILKFDYLKPTTVLLPTHLDEDDIRGGNYELNEDAERKVKKYLEIRDRYCGDACPWDNLQVPSNWGGVSITSFGPSRSSTANLNNHSVVTVFKYGGVKVLIPGDNESPSWIELLNRPDFVDAIAGTDVFVASHHGRESGFYRPLFDHFTPLVTIISDGPVVGTSVTENYTELTQGRAVQKRSGGREYRKSLTTRRDGYIVVEVDQVPAGNMTLDVEVA